MQLILSILALLSLQEVLSDDVERAYEWKDIKVVGVEPSTYNPEDVIPTGVVHDAESKMLFIGIPRKFPNVPTTMAELNTRTYNSGKLRSPPLNIFSGKSSKPLTSVYQPVIDDCRRLWVLDVGIVESPSERNKYPIKNPALIAYDLTKQNYPEIHRYELTGEVAKTPLGYGGFAVDVINPNTGCGDDDATYVYIANFVKNTLIVYDMKKRNAWNFKDDSFKPESTSTFTHNGKQYTIQAGIFGITLGDRNEEGDRSAYYLAGSSTKLYSVSTKSLKEKGATLTPELIGDRGSKTEAIALAYDPETKVIFFTEADSGKVSCWNTMKELKSENVDVIYSSPDFNFGTDLMVDSEGVLWFMANGQPPIDEKVVYDEPRIRVLKVKTKVAIKGKKCEIK